MHHRTYKYSLSAFSLAITAAIALQCFPKGRNDESGGQGPTNEPPVSSSTPVLVSLNFGGKISGKPLELYGASEAVDNDLKAYEKAMDQPIRDLLTPLATAGLKAALENLANNDKSIFYKRKYYEVGLQNGTASTVLDNITEQTLSFKDFYTVKGDFLNYDAEKLGIAYLGPAIDQQSAGRLSAMEYDTYEKMKACVEKMQGEVNEDNTQKAAKAWEEIIIALEAALKNTANHNAGTKVIRGYFNTLGDKEPGQYGIRTRTSPREKVAVTIDQSMLLGLLIYDVAYALYATRKPSIDDFMINKKGLTFENQMQVLQSLTQVQGHQTAVICLQEFPKEEEGALIAAFPSWQCCASEVIKKKASYLLLNPAYCANPTQVAAEEETVVASFEFGGKTYHVATNHADKNGTQAAKYIKTALKAANAGKETTEGIQFFMAADLNVQDGNDASKGKEPIKNVADALASCQVVFAKAGFKNGKVRTPAQCQHDEIGKKKAFSTDRFLTSTPLAEGWQEANIDFELKPMFDPSKPIPSTANPYDHHIGFVLLPFMQQAQ